MLSSSLMSGSSSPKALDYYRKANLSEEDTDATSTASDHQTNIFYPYNPHIRTIQQVIGWHVYDPRGKFMAAIQTRTVDSLSPMVSQWNSIAPQIVTLLFKENVKWTGVELFQRAQAPLVESFTTVLISVEDLSQPSLVNIAKFAFKLCCTNISPTSSPPFIEIVEGHLKLQMDFEQRLGQLKVPYNNVPQMGASIGVNGNNHSAGTLGGYVELYNAMGNKKTCALTCHHVVCPPQSLRFDPTAPDFFPYLIGTSITAVDSPSLLDHQKSIDIDKVHLGKIQAKKVEQISKIEPLGDQVPKNSQLGLARMMEKEEAFLNRIRLAMGAHREIGTIFASSGYRPSKTNCRLDWGLVELHGDRIGHNKMPDGTSVMSREFEASEVGEDVVKFGRSTGQTLGKVNPTESYIHFQGTSYEHSSQEMVIVGSAENFSERGDSGSFVISETLNELIGILWGGLTSREATFVTSMEAIRKDIVEITGYETRLLGSDLRDSYGGS